MKLQTNESSNPIKNNSRTVRNSKRWVSATIALSALVGIVGCGTNFNPTSNTDSQTAANTKQASETTFPLTVTDEAGHKVTIPKVPKHIASITLGTDEILSDLVPKSQIALVTTWSSDPTESNILDFVKGIPQIKDANAEQIIDVHPDLVLMASYTKPGVVDQINQANIPTFEFSDFNSIQDIEKNIQVIGQLVGQVDKAKQINEKMENQLQQIKEAVQSKKAPTVLDYSSYGFAAGAGTTVNDIIVHAGGKNAASQLKGWQKITDEQIVKLNPDVIIFPNSDVGFNTKLFNDKALQSVNAITRHQVYGISDAELSSVSQYITQSVADVAHALYPDVQLGK